MQSGSDKQLEFHKLRRLLAEEARIRLEEENDRLLDEIEELRHMRSKTSFSASKVPCLTNSLEDATYSTSAEISTQTEEDNLIFVNEESLRSHVFQLVSEMAANTEIPTPSDDLSGLTSRVQKLQEQLNAEKKARLELLVRIVRGEEHIEGVVAGFEDNLKTIRESRIAVLEKDKLVEDLVDSLQQSEAAREETLELYESVCRDISALKSAKESAESAAERAKQQSFKLSRSLDHYKTLVAESAAMQPASMGMPKRLAGRK